MRVLDECVNPRVAEAFLNHEVEPVKVDGLGWHYQRRADGVGATEKFGIVVAVPDNNFKYFRPIFSHLLKAVECIDPGQVVHIVSPEIHS